MVDHLPPELLNLITLNLNLRDIINFCRLNKKLQDFYLLNIIYGKNIRFRRLIILIQDVGYQIEPSIDRSLYPHILVFHSLNSLKIENFRKIYKDLEFLIILSKSTLNDHIDNISFNYDEYFRFFKNLNYIEFSNPNRYSTTFFNGELDETRIRFRSIFNEEIASTNYLDYVALCDGQESIKAIERNQISSFSVRRGAKQYVSIQNFKFISIKKCLIEFESENNREILSLDRITELKYFKMSCIGVNQFLNDLFGKQTELYQRQKRTFKIYFEHQEIQRDILNISLLRAIQCRIKCMEIHILNKNQLQELNNSARRYPILCDYVGLVDYKPNIYLEKIIKFKKLLTLYISRPEINSNEINLIIQNFKKIINLQIVNTKIDQNFFDEIATNFPEIETLSLTNCQIGNFQFIQNLMNLKSFKKLVINKTN